MAKKQAIVKETAAAATPARAAKPKTPRVKAAQHSKAVSSESVPVAAPIAAHAVPENPREAIELIAYGYWESRGYQGGAPLEDWVRAEQEYRQRSAAQF